MELKENFLSKIKQLEENEIVQFNSLIIGSIKKVEEIEYNQYKLSMKVESNIIYDEIHINHSYRPKIGDMLYITSICLKKKR